MKLIIKCFCLICLICCSSNKSSKNKIEHPTKENLSFDNESHFNVIKNGDYSVQNDSLNKFIDKIKSIDQIFSVGVNYGKETEMFGRIIDIVMDAQKRIYVLDEHKQQIRVFDNKGAYITTLGGKGQGPGEFERARSMSIYNDEMLLVSNGYRMEVFDIRDDSMEFVETHQFDKRIQSICTMGDMLFMHNIQMLGNQADADTNGLHMIHSFLLPSFEPVLSFGKPYYADNNLVADRLTIGNISCNEGASTVLFAFDKMPVIHGYSAESGNIKWITRIDDLHFAKIVETNQNGKMKLSYKQPESRIFDQFLPPVTMGNRFELLQSHRSSFLEGERKSEVLSIVLDSSNGKGVFVERNNVAITDINTPNVASFSDDYMSFSVHEIN